MGFTRMWLTAACATGMFALSTADISSAAQRKPSGATALCVDGTYSKAQSQQGACSSHGGVKTWYGASTKAEPKATKAEPKATKAEPQAKAETRTSRPEAKAAPTKGQTEPKASGTSGKAEPKAAPTQEEKVQISPRRGGTPADATAKCKDGTFSHAAQHSGACSNHGGVAEWYR
jgi:hypothetical protein